MNPKGLLLSGALMAALCVSAAPPAPKQNSEATAIGTERAIATIKHFSTSFPNQSQAPPRGLFCACTRLRLRVFSNFSLVKRHI